MARIKHIAISSQDPEKTATFFIDVFGLERIGKIERDDAQGYYLSDGNVNIAVLKYKDDSAAGEFGADYSGIHHIGFEVDNVAEADAKLKEYRALALDGNASLRKSRSNGGHDRNVGLRYEGPDGIMIDISQNGWVGTNGR